jgi:hypothetical protein
MCPDEHELLLAVRSGLSSLDAARDDPELCRRVVAQAFPPPLACGSSELRRGSPKRERRGGGRPGSRPPGSPNRLLKKPAT